MKVLKIEPSPSLEDTKTAEISDFLGALETKTYVHLPCGMLSALMQSSLSATATLSFVYLFALGFFERHCGDNQARCASVSLKTLADRLGKGRDVAARSISNLKSFGLISGDNGAGQLRNFEIGLPEPLKKTLHKTPDKNQIAGNASCAECWDSIEQNKYSVQIPFHLLKHVIGDPNLSQSSKLLWFLLYEHAHAILKASGKAQIQIQIKTLMEASGFPHTTLFRALGDLEAADYLSRKRTQIGQTNEQIEITLQLPDPIVEALKQSRSRGHKKASSPDPKPVSTDLSPENVDNSSHNSKNEPPIIPKTSPSLYTPNYSIKNNFRWTEPSQAPLDSSTPAQKPETARPPPSPVPATSAPLSGKVFFNDFDNRKQKRGAQMSAQEIFERFEKNAQKLLAAGQRPVDAKRLSASNLQSQEKRILLEAARKSEAENGCSKLRSLLACPKTRFVVFGKIVPEQSPKLALERVLEQARLYDLRCQQKKKPTQKKSEQAPLSPEEVVSLEPEALLSGKHLRQLDFFLNKMALAKELRGYARGISLGLLRSEIAFMAATFPMRDPKGDRTALAISIACKQIRAGRWGAPFGHARVRERIWEAEKSRLYGVSKKDREEARSL